SSSSSYTKPQIAQAVWGFFFVARKIKLREQSSLLQVIRARLRFRLYRHQYVALGFYWRLFRLNLEQWQLSFPLYGFLRLAVFYAS
ncbi:hypothetical protein N5F00_24170, partial [Pseudomonas chengduensis]